MFFTFLLALLSVKGMNGANDFVDFSNYSMENWTTCEEFLANTTFDPSKVVDVDWKIFFFWSLHLEDSYNIRFSVPTTTLVDRFRVELDEEISPPVNWTNADFFMETSIDLSGLFIKTDTPGIYRLVPSLAFEYYSVPLFIFGLKYVEPGYLGLMNCRHRMCYALAPVDKMPENDKLEAEANKLGFHGEFSRSYISVTPASSVEPVPDPMEMDDDEEDEHFEIEKDPENIPVL